jgi:OOP family OmpA-OmpF porin
MKKAIILVSSALALSLPAMAQVSGGFLELGAGATKANITVPANFTASENSTGVSFLGGYMVNQYFGAEVGYADLGKASLSTTANVNSTLYGKPFVFNGTATAEGKSTGLLAGIRLVVPVNDKFSLGARAGLMSWTTDVTTSANVAWTYDGAAYAANTAAKKSYTGSDAYYGIRASYALTNSVALGLGYTQYKLGGDIDTKVNATDIFLTYRF